MGRLVVSTLALAVAVTACTRGTPEGPAPRPALSGSAPASTSASAAAVAPPLDPRLTRPAPERLVAIGDLHGDLAAARRALRLAGAIDEKDAWVGGKLMVVQTGDEIDRADDDRAVLDLLERLRAQATAAGGEVIPLLGNHEIMNVAFDFRYVTPGAMAAFADVKPSPSASPPAGAPADPVAKGRVAAFAPGGPYARLLAGRSLFVQVGSSIFVHGGILTKHVKFGLSRMDEGVHRWLLGEVPSPPSIVTGEDGPVWTRMYSAAPGKEECAELEATLEALGLKRMVMGHTVQRAGISRACDGRGWRIDVGLSKAYGGPTEVLEIRGDGVKVLREGAPPSP